MNFWFLLEHLLRVKRAYVDPFFAHPAEIPVISSGSPPFIKFLVTDPPYSCRDRCFAAADNTYFTLSFCVNQNKNPVFGGQTDVDIALLGFGTVKRRASFSHVRLSALLSVPSSESIPKGILMPRSPHWNHGMPWICLDQV